MQTKSTVSRLYGSRGWNEPFYIDDVNIYDYQIFGIRRWNTYLSWCESFGPKTMVIA